MSYSVQQETVEEQRHRTRRKFLDSLVCGEKVYWLRRQILWMLKILRNKPERWINDWRSEEKRKEKKRLKTIVKKRWNCKENE